MSLASQWSRVELASGVQEATVPWGNDSRTGWCRQRQTAFANDGSLARKTRQDSILPSSWPYLTTDIVDDKVIRGAQLL